MHVAQIDKLSPVEALAYFTAHSDEIDFRKQGDLRKALERNIEIDQAKSEARAKRLPAKQKSVYWIPLPGAYTLKGSPCHLL